MIKPGILEQFGLNEKEARVYLASLELGAASVQEIAALARIHRVSTYDLLESLKEKGFVRDSLAGKKRLLLPMEPEQIAASIKIKEQLFLNLIPELSAIRNKKDIKPRVLYYEGRNEVWQSYLDYHNYKIKYGNDLVYGSAELLFSSFQSELGSIIDSEYAISAGSKNLVERQTENLPDIEVPKKYFGTVKILPEGKKISGNIFIYGQNILTIDWNKFIAVRKDDKDSAENQRCIFNLLWELLP